MSVARSKLQKRVESSFTSSSAANIDGQQENISHQCKTNNTESNQNYAVRQQQQLKVFSKSDNSNNNLFELETISYTRTSGVLTEGWVFPPKAPSPKICSNDGNNDAMAVAVENGLKGFKKQFSGRFKRLVSHKKDVPGPIPPELRPQLKMIYVY